jgi:chemotaxis protein MotA
VSASGFGFILSILYIVGMFYWTARSGFTHYFELHGIVVVFLGTAVIALISVPWQEIKDFFPLIKAVARKEKDDGPELVNLVVELAEKARLGFDELKKYLDKIKEPFLRDSVILLIEGFDRDAIATILIRRLEVQKDRENRQAKMYRNLGKYPPACGLMGTCLGLVVMLASLGQEGAGEKIGPAMSVALIGTLWGVIAANFIIVPIADNLVLRTQKTMAQRQMLMEGILLIKDKTSPVMVRQLLMSHLSPLKRDLVKGVGGPTATAKAS